MSFYSKPSKAFLFKKNSLHIAILMSVSAGAVAQSPSPDGAVVEEVVVTAQKREQSVQTISAAVSEISGDDFDARNIDDPFDLSDKVPSLVLTEAQGYRRTASIRGIGNEIPDNAATKPGVAYHVDGVFMTNDFALFQDLVDIERVEITRGPDGTIYGNSSSGGAINVITKKPSLDNVEGFIESEIGSYNTTNTKGSFNLPLSETTALRVSASLRNRDGFTKNIPNPTRSFRNVPGEHDDLDDENNESLNAQFKWQPQSNFSTLISLQHYNQDSNGPALKGPFDTVSDDPRVVSHDTTEFFQVENTIGSLIMDWRNSWANIKGLASVQDYEMKRQLDADRSPLTANDPAPLPVEGDVNLLGELPVRKNIGGLTQRDDSVTAEINVSSRDDQPGFLDWQFGTFYLDTDVKSDTRNFIDGDRDGQPIDTSVIGFSNPDTEFQNSDIRSFESYATFGNISFEFFDDFRFTGGARWTKNRFSDKRCNIFNGCLTENGRTGDPATPSENNDNVTFKTALDYNITPDNMIYTSVATGIKPAASNNGFVEDKDGAGFFPEVFEEEKVTTYELGSKNFFYGRRLQLNATAYYSDIENYLYQSAGLSVTGNGVSGGSNLPESETYGIEVESVAQITPNLRLDVNMSAADSKINEGRLAVDRGEQVNVTAGLTDDAEIEETIRSIAQDLTGNELPKIPEFVANVSLSYEQQVSGGRLTSQVIYDHRGEYFNRVFNSPERDLVPSYDRAHLNFNYQAFNAPWSLSLNIQNLFDSDDVSSLHTDDFFQGQTSKQFLPPRVITMSARYDF